MEHLFLIKLGGSLITDKGQEKVAKPEVMRRLAGEIRSALKKTDRKLVVAHGAGSFAHRSATKYKVNEGLKGVLQFKGYPYVSSDAIQLNRKVMRQFLKVKLPAISFSPQSMIFSENRRAKSIFTDSLIHALKLGYLPVLYGDTVFDKKIGFLIFSTEMVLGALTNVLYKKFKISFIYCGNTDGVFDSKGRTIPKITNKNIHEVEKFISGSENVDVTGGMIHKVRESLEMAKKGHDTIIINGNRKGELKKAILGEKHRGTLISG